METAQANINRQIQYRTINIVDKCSEQVVSKVAVATVNLDSEKTKFAVDFAICAPSNTYDKNWGREKAELRLMGKLTGGSKASIQFEKKKAERMRDILCNIVREKANKLSWFNPADFDIV